MGRESNTVPPHKSRELNTAQWDALPSQQEHTTHTPQEGRGRFSDAQLIGHHHHTRTLYDAQHHTSAESYTHAISADAVLQ